MDNLISKTFRLPVSVIDNLNEIHKYYCEFYGVKLTKNDILSILIHNVYRDISVKQILDKYR